MLCSGILPMCELSTQNAICHLRGQRDCSSLHGEWGSRILRCYYLGGLPSNGRPPRDVGGAGMKRLTPLFLLMLIHIVLAQQPGLATNQAIREVRGQTVISNVLPKAELTFAREFRHVGSQRVNLYGNAEAEQHLFIKAGDGGLVERFYWVQFEHFLPTNKRTYEYSADRTTTIGGISFIYDVKSWPDYASMQMEDPQSDGAAIAHLLAQNRLSFSKRAVRVRMFHLPTPDRRSELMIIYGESLPDDSSVPVRKDGVELDKESPESAKLFLEHARQNMNVTVR